MLPFVRQRNEPGQAEAAQEPDDTFVSLGSVAKIVADKARDGRRQGESEGRDNMLAGDGEARLIADS